MSKVTIQNIQKEKSSKSKLVMLTAYDYPFARLIDQAGVDLILVGDSLAMVVLGHDSTEQVTMDEMIHHAKAVRRGVAKAVLVGDMPKCALEADPEKVKESAQRFISEAGCEAVKIEWKEGIDRVVQDIVQAGIPVMGHVGLTPQTASQEGGFGVRGKDVESALKIIEQASRLQEAGCFSVVLECIPDILSKKITEQLSIPTIGIGSGSYCDGQVLVMHDLLGLFDRFIPKFVKQYVQLTPLIQNAFKDYVKDVRTGVFPKDEHVFKMKSDVWEQIDRKLVGK